MNGAFVLLGVSAGRADTLAFQHGYTLFLYIFCVISSPLSFILNLTFLHLTRERQSLTLPSSELYIAKYGR